MSGGFVSQWHNAPGWKCDIFYSKVNNGIFYMITRPEMQKEKKNGFN